MDRRSNLSLQDPVVTPDKYSCSTCGKSFLSPQAPGGHRSSNVKVQGGDFTAPFHYSYVKNGPNANAIKQLEENNVSKKAVYYNTYHTFTLICNNNFPSVLAHGFQNHADHVPSHLVTSTWDEEKEDLKVLKLNLNELPNQDGEDGLEPGNTAS